MDHSRRRRAHFDPVELVPRGDAALDQFGFLALRLAKFLDDIGAKILIEADDLKLGLADLRFRLGDRGYQLPALALDPRRLALQRREPRQRHQPFVVQVLNAGQFAGDQFELLGLGCDLGFKAGNLLAELGDPALQQILLARARVQARLEQRIFRRQQSSDGILVDAACKLGRNFGPVQTVAFGHQPRDPGAQLIELLAHHLEIGLGLGRVEPHQQIAGRHPHAVMDLDLRDNAAGGMLDGLDVGLNDEIAGHRDGTRQRHEHEPAAGQQRREDENPKPGSQLVLERPPCPRLQAVIRKHRSAAPDRRY